MKFLSESVTRALGHVTLSVKENSPHIMFGLGVVGVVGAGVMACRATLKLETTIDKARVDLDAVTNMKETSEVIGTPYAKQEYHRDLGIVSMRAVTEFGKLYGPSIAVGCVSIGLLTGAHVQLTKRNTALTVTLAAVSKAYAEYRGRVRDVLGVERELDIYENARMVEVVTEDGRTEVEEHRDVGGGSPYARLFDEFSAGWQPNAHLNSMFVQGVQNQMNNRLRAKGHVFLNEVLDDLGIARFEGGQIVGWLWNSEQGDNYIDFGLSRPSAASFVDGNERSVWLDFNVDGPIHTKLPKV